MYARNVMAAAFAASMSLAFLPTASADCGGGNGPDIDPYDTPSKGCQQNTNSNGGDSTTTIDFSGALSNNTVEGGNATIESGAVTNDF